MLNEIADAKITNSRWDGLYNGSGAAALILAALFLIAIIDLLVASLVRGTEIGWF